MYYMRVIQYRFWSIVLITDEFNFISDFFAQNSLEFSYEKKAFQMWMFHYFVGKK